MIDVDPNQITGDSDFQIKMDTTSAVFIDRYRHFGVNTVNPQHIYSTSMDTGDAAINVRVDTADKYAHLIAQGEGAAALDLVHIGGETDERWLQLLLTGGVARFGSQEDDGAAWVHEYILGMDSSSGNVSIGTTPAAAVRLYALAPDAQSTVNVGLEGTTYSDAPTNYGVRGYALGGGGITNAGVYGYASGATNNYHFRDGAGNYSNASKIHCNNDLYVADDVEVAGEIVVSNGNLSSGFASLADDVATNFTPSNLHGFIAIGCQTSCISALICYDCEGTVTIQITSQSGTSFVVGTVALTDGAGDGTDGKFNVNVFNGKIYLKNRLGGT